MLGPLRINPLGTGLTENRTILACILGCNGTRSCWVLKWLKQCMHNIPMRFLLKRISSFWLLCQEHLYCFFVIWLVSFNVMPPFGFEFPSWERVLHLIFMLVHVCIASMLLTMSRQWKSWKGGGLRDAFCYMGLKDALLSSTASLLTWVVPY